MNIQLYSTFHKPFYKPAAEFVIPIHAGKILAADAMHMQGDDTGENISALNPFFAELTPLYWIVKNAPRNCEAWGLCHYRRYFMVQRTSIFAKKKSDYKLRDTPWQIDKVVNIMLYRQMQEKLKEHDAIVQPPKWIHNKKGNIKTLEYNFISHHIPEHWEILKEVLLEKYPTYEGSWEAFRNLTKMSFYNMMVAKWKIWDEYAAWLFDILFEVHRRIGPIADPSQQRAVAFMSERLMNLYMLHNKVKTAYLPVAVFDKV